MTKMSFSACPVAAYNFHALLQEGREICPDKTLLFIPDLPNVRLEFTKELFDRVQVW